MLFDNSILFQFPQGPSQLYRPLFYYDFEQKPLAMKTPEGVREQSAAYLHSWLNVLRVKEHKRWIIQAASQASRAAGFILNREACPPDGAPPPAAT